MSGVRSIFIPLAALVPGIEYTLWLDQKKFYLMLRIWLVLNAIGNNEHLSGVQADCAVVHINPKCSLEDNKRLIGFLVIVPHEVTLKPKDALHNPTCGNSRSIKSTI